MESLPKWPDQQGLKILCYSTLWRTGWEPSSLFSTPLGRDWTGPVFVGPAMGHPSKEGKYRPQERFDFPNLTGSLGIKGAKVKLSTTTPPPKNKHSTDVDIPSQWLTEATKISQSQDGLHWQQCFPAPPIWNQLHCKISVSLFLQSVHLSPNPKSLASKNKEKCCLWGSPCLAPIIKSGL